MYKTRNKRQSYIFNNVDLFNIFLILNSIQTALKILFLTYLFNMLFPLNPIRHGMFYTLCNMSWGPFGLHGDFENYTAFCNKTWYTEKNNCFLSNCEINYFQKISYGLFYNNKLTLLINLLE